MERENERRAGLAVAVAIVCGLALCGCASDDTDAGWPAITYRSVTVERGDTLSEIAERNNVSENTLIALNGVNNRNDIYPGQVLRVPDVARESRRVASADGKETTISYYSSIPRPKPAQRDSGVTPAPRPDVTVSPARSGEFVWPVEGHIISAFGTSDTGERNDGINISATLGEPIHAAAAGIVTYAGNELKGYGNLVLIRHDDGYVTAYAHAESINVARGDRVVKGQVIGYAGATGDVRTPQVHFEIRKGVEPVDPKPLLMAASY